VINRVEVSKLAEKQLRRAPQRINAKFLAWADDVEERGLEEVRKVPGWHDHPLKGQLQGRRAIYLSRQWRAVYVIKEGARGESTIEFVHVEEVHPHDY
jgi:toxin HigB-1